MKNEIKIMEKKTLENEINVNIFPFVDEIYVMFIVTCKSIFSNSYNDGDKLPKSLIFLFGK